MEPGILDGNPCGKGQCLGEHEVVARKLGPSNLVGQVEVAVDLLPDPDGNAEERSHRWMIEGEPRTIGVGVQIRYAERFRIGDDQAQDAETFRSISYSHLVVWREADRDELGKRGPLAIQNSDCTIVSPRYGAGLSLIHISEPTRRTPISYAVFCLK